MPAGKNGYRGPGSVNLKGRNTWVRQSEAVKAEDAQAKPEEKRPVKVGAYKLVRSPSLVPPQLRNASHAARKIPPTGRNKFKYERPKEGATAAVPDSAPKQPERPQRAAPVKPKAAATARPSQPKRKGNLTWVNPALKTATAAGRVKPGSTLQSKIKTSLLPPRRKVQSTPKVSLRPSKEKWNKYVRPGAEKLPLKAAPIARASSLNSTAASGLRRSPRLTTQQHRSSVAPRTQRATKLLRLGGRLYTLGRRSKGRSLTLQATVPTGSAQSGLRQLSAAAQRTSRQPKPKPAEANVNLPIKRKLAVRKTSLKPSARLKVSKIKYCPVYCHKGQCPRRGRGCPYVHDPTKRAVCTKWLLGRCELGKTCPLQHQRKPELMPACVHFLQGSCSKTDCPWLHVSVKPDAGHCLAFLRGYCAAGTSCTLKHYTLGQIKEEKRLVASGRGKKSAAAAAKVAAKAAKKAEEAQQRAAAAQKRKARYFTNSEGDEDGIAALAALSGEDGAKNADASDHSHSEVSSLDEIEEGSHDGGHGAESSDDGAAPAIEKDDPEEASSADEAAMGEQDEGSDSEGGPRKRLRRRSLLDFIQL